MPVDDEAQKEMQRLLIAGQCETEKVMASGYGEAVDVLLEPCSTLQEQSILAITTSTEKLYDIQRPLRIQSFSFI